MEGDASKQAQAAVPRKLKGHELRKNHPLVAEVCRLLCKGYKSTEIQKEIESMFQVVMTRQAVYDLVSYAAGQKQWLKFAPTSEDVLAWDLKKIYGQQNRLREIAVAPSDQLGDVAYLGAALLMKLICEHVNKDEVHLGFAGGRCMRNVAKALSEFLRVEEPDQNLPKRLVFHALLGGMNVQDPSWDPNCFFLHFVNDDARLQVETRNIHIWTKAIVTAEEFKTAVTTQEAFKAKDDIDILVSSAAHWSADHVMYEALRDECPETVSRLRESGCCADYFWRPLGLGGPIEEATPKRTMTLFDLHEIPDFIAKGGQVVLVVGPCGACEESKVSVIRTLLNPNGRRFATHVALHRSCATDLLKSA